MREERVEVGARAEYGAIHGAKIAASDEREHDDEPATATAGAGSACAAAGGAERAG